MSCSIYKRSVLKIHSFPADLLLHRLVATFISATILYMSSTLVLLPRTDPLALIRSQIGRRFHENIISLEYVRIYLL